MTTSGLRASALCANCGHEYGEHTGACEKGIRDGRSCGCRDFISEPQCQTRSPSLTTQRIPANQLYDGTDFGRRLAEDYGDPRYSLWPAEEDS